jgi:hypothetical protein
MGQTLLAILKGMASTMEIFPQEAPLIGPTDRTERMRRPWERTGRAIQHSIDKYASEKTAK